VLDNWGMSLPGDTGMGLCMVHPHFRTLDKPWYRPNDLPL
jgi:hypothetical protein